MGKLGKLVGVVLGGTLGTSALADPTMGPRLDPAPPPMTPPMTTPMMPMGAMSGSMTAGPAKVNLADVVDPNYRDAVLSVVRKPTISTRGASDGVICDPAVYQWLLEHPDRVSLAWNRLNVPCVQITDAGNNRFLWVDTDGSEIVWQTVGRFPEGMVWYATGKVKANALTPTVPVKVVVIVYSPKKVLTDGRTAIFPVMQGYLQTDSRAATTVMRILGPTAPKIAEQAADQLLFFFNGIARYIHAHPERRDELLAPPKQ